MKKVIYFYVDLFEIFYLFVRDNSSEIPPEKRLFLVINFEDPCYWKLKSSLQTSFEINWLLKIKFRFKLYIPASDLGYIHL